MAKQLPLPNHVFVEILKEEKVDVTTTEGLAKARSILNTLCNTNFTSSELIGGSLLVFRTACGLLSREYHLN